jgi:7,8-dihydropterin-6-yl-methyl-4-(beta-D-ribofuranosyl)aminobenzene 5'-phosphate synthase
MLPIESLEITTLTENTAGRGGVQAEWGLSIFIKAGDTRVLLDTGTTQTAVHNADVLGVDLGEIEALVLSHGHTDHTGGLPAVLTRIGRPMRVVCHPGIWEDKCSRKKDDSLRFAGVPARQTALEDLGARFELTTTPVWLSDDLVTSGEEPMTTEFETVADNLVIRRGSEVIPDPVLDDLSIFIRTTRGLVVILGCAHRGMINILEHARRITGEERIYLALGGTHLIGADERQMRQTIAALRRLDVQWLGVSHCTGQKQAAVLAGEFGDRFFYNNAGTVLQFPLENGDEMT